MKEAILVRIPLFKQYGTFVCVGGFGFLFSLSVTYSLTEFAHVFYLVSHIASSLLTWTLVFFLNSKLTFSGHNPSAQGVRYLRFLSLYGLVALLNFSLVYILTSLLEIYYLLSIASVTVVLSVLTFSVSKKFVFHH